MRTVVPFLLVPVLAACADSAETPASQRKAQAERFFQGVYGCAPEVVDELAADSIVLSYPIFSELYGTPVFRGREAVRGFAERFCSRWEDPDVTIHERIAEDGDVVLVWSFSARFAGPEIPGAPTPGQEQTWGGITLFRFDDAGRIAAEIGEESAPGPVARGSGYDMSTASPLSGRVVSTSFESDGVELPALLHRRSTPEARALAIYLHGNPGSPLDESSVVADALVPVGVDVFRFNYRGLWGNGGTFTLTHALGDLDAALAYLTAPETVDAFGLRPSRIVVIGSSFGTAVGLLAAARDSRIHGSVNLVPCDHGYFGQEYPNPDSELRSFFEMAQEALFGENGVIPQDPALFPEDLVRNAEAYRFPPLAEELMDRELLFLVGLDDEICYLEDHFIPVYRELTERAHQALEVRVLPMSHGFDGVGIEALFGQVANWFERTYPIQ